MPLDSTAHVPRLPAAVEAAVYYVAAEGLTNIAKYVHATAAAGRLEEADGGVVLRISDNGTGAANPERGTGLRGLADRVEALGGKLELDSRLGHGTLLRRGSMRFAVGNALARDPTLTELADRRT